MTLQEFSEHYEKDVDFKEMVDYLNRLASIYSFIDDVANAKADKASAESRIGKYLVSDIVMMFYSTQKKLKSIIDEKADAAMRQFIDKLITKEV